MPLNTSKFRPLIVLSSDVTVAVEDDRGSSKGSKVKGKKKKKKAEQAKTRVIKGQHGVLPLRDSDVAYNKTVIGGLTGAYNKCYEMHYSQRDTMKMRLWRRFVRKHLVPQVNFSIRFAAHSALDPHLIQRLILAMALSYVIMSSLVPCDVTPLNQNTSLLSSSL
jgi:hypothetical protein